MTIQQSSEDVLTKLKTTYCYQCSEERQNTVCESPCLRQREIILEHDEQVKAQERRGVIDEVEKGLGICNMGIFHQRLIESLRKDAPLTTTERSSTLPLNDQSLYTATDEQLSEIEHGCPPIVICNQIRAKRLSDELESAYRNGFNDGQAEERGKVLDEFMQAIEFRFDDTNQGRGVVGTIRGIKESLRSESRECPR